MSNENKILSYGEYRSLIKNGDVLLYRGTGLTSNLIQKISGSPYSHVGIAAWWNDRLMVLEAVGKGVVASTLSDNLQRYHGGVDYFWCKENIAEDKRITMVQFAQAQLGKEYNRLQVLVSGISAALGLSLKDEEGRFKHAAGKYFCSEYVADIYHQANLDLAMDMKSKKTSPDAIAQSPMLKLKGILKGDY